MKKWIPFALYAFSLQNCQAQVESKSYAAMLYTLLSHSVPEYTVVEATAGSQATVWLDARETREFEVSHIAGAQPIGYDHFTLEAMHNVPKDAHIVVYCSVGYRSEKISEKLLAAGYTDVHNLYGGIFEWVNQGKPVVNTQGLTKEVHAYNKKWGVWLRKGKKVYN